ncbi:hypothetical protein Patl1_10401 [Pistacia atlantica]|uniref:Uncharacterized protein n=1 Tax=Pistacia atlantica TaxID=434234 RepID=A0ACC1A3V0_9ROSI|nr:hypothetical protein Patl1_10401 [Pistacia atlantica]
MMIIQIFKKTQSQVNFSIANATIDPMAATSSSSSAAFHLPAQVISIKLDGTNFLA